jgi:hypothetical protein
MEIKMSIILCTTISLSGVYISKCRDFRRRLYSIIYSTRLFFLHIDSVNPTAVNYENKLILQS